jgi:hypothetical protein
MAAQMKISHDEAAKRFDEAQAKLKQARDQAVQLPRTRLMLVLPQPPRRRSLPLVCCCSA